MTTQAGGRDPHFDRTGPRRPDLASRRVVWSAFAISAVLHLFFILLYPSLFGDLAPLRLAVRDDELESRLQGMEVIRLREDEEAPAEVERPDEPQLEDAEERAAVVLPRSVEETVGRELEGRRSAAERFRVNLTDERLWSPMPREFIELTPTEREELLLAGRIQEWYDSLAAAADADAAWTDWTYTDGDGDRWGIADGRLYLGSYSVPLPAFTAAPGPAGTRAAWEADEMARQRLGVATQQTVRERMEAIRARRDRERAESRERAEARTDTTESR